MDITTCAVDRWSAILYIYICSTSIRTTLFTGDGSCYLPHRPPRPFFLLVFSYPFTAASRNSQENPACVCSCATCRGSHGAPSLGTTSHLETSVGLLARAPLRGLFPLVWFALGAVVVVVLEEFHRKQRKRGRGVIRHALSIPREYGFPPYRV